MIPVALSLISASMSNLKKIIGGKIDEAKNLPGIFEHRLNFVCDLVVCRCDIFQLSSDKLNPIILGHSLDIESIRMEILMGIEMSFHARILQ